MTGANLRWRGVCIVAASLGMVVSMVSDASAVLYAYEGFDYTAGSPLQSLSGGTGWDLPANDPAYTAFITSPGWQGMTRNNTTTIETIGADTIQANSLSYTDSMGNVLQTSGGYLLSTGSAGTSQGGRFLSERRDSGSTWISFLIQRSGESDGDQAGGMYPRGANLAFFDQTTDGVTNVDHETLDLGPNNSNVILPLNGVDEDRFQVRVPTVDSSLTEANLPNSPVSRPTSNTNGTGQVRDAFMEVNRQDLNFYVMRIDHLGGNMDGDDLRIWMNPRLDETPSDASVSAAYIHADLVDAATAQSLASPYTTYPTQGTPPGGTADASVGDQAFNRIRFFSGNMNASPFAEMKVDEIRVGSTYDDVAPFIPIVTGVPGDYNENDVVDAADYVAWRKAQSAGAMDLPNRGSGLSGAVGNDDYTFWRERFGNTSGSAAGGAIGSVAVPEPITGILMAIGWIVLASEHRSRRGR